MMASVTRWFGLAGALHGAGIARRGAAEGLLDHFAAYDVHRSGNRAPGTAHEKD